MGIAVLTEIPGYRRLGKEVSLLMAKSCTIGNRGSCVPGITGLNTGKPWAPSNEVYRYKAHGSHPLVFWGKKKELFILKQYLSHVTLSEPHS